jgi:hypothetical protein
MKIKENHSKWWANLPPNEFFRVGNQNIGRNFTMASDPPRPALPPPLMGGSLLKIFEMTLRFLGLLDSRCC